MEAASCNRNTRAWINMLSPIIEGPLHIFHEQVGQDRGFLTLQDFS